MLAYILFGFRIGYRHGTDLAVAFTVGNLMICWPVVSRSPHRTFTIWLLAFWGEVEGH